MRIIESTIIASIFLLIISCNSNNNKTEKIDLQKESVDKTQKNYVNISASDDSYELVMYWAKYFKQKYPDVILNIQKSDTFIDNNNNIIITTNYPENYDKLWHINIAKDIIIPIINSNNPFIQKLVFQGIKPEELYSLLFTGNISTWDALVDSKKGKNPVIIYRQNDMSGATTVLRKFLHAENDNMLGKILNNDAEIVASVKSNIFGLGFCSFNLAYTSNGKYKTSDIYVLPFDINSNGIADDDELVFDRRDILLDAYKKGKYPVELTRFTRVFMKSKPENEATLNFIYWLLGEGQNYLEQFGLITLSIEEIEIAKKF